MSSSLEMHPSEEFLADIVMGEASAEVVEHVKNCAVCARAVEELRTAAQGLEQLKEQEVPDSLSRRILEIPSRDARSQSFRAQNNSWLRMSVLMGLGIALLALFLYYFFINLS